MIFHNKLFHRQNTTFYRLTIAGYPITLGKTFLLRYIYIIISTQSHEHTIIIS